MKLLKALAIFLKARLFALIRKLIFLLLVAVTAKLLGFELSPKAVLKFFPFMLAYYALYLANDIIDLEKDRAKKVIRGSKVLALGKISLREASLLSTLFLTFALALSFLLTKTELLLLSFILFLGIFRSFIENELLRALSLALLEFLNLILFFLFFNTLNKDSTLISALISLLYALIFKKYREFSKKGKLSFKFHFAAIVFSLLILFLLPINFLLKAYYSLTLLLIISAWLISMLTNKYLPLYIAFLIFLLLSLSIIFAIPTPQI